MSTATVRPLFEIGDDLAAIQSRIIEAEGVLTPEIEVELNAVLDELGDKVDAYGGKIRSLQARQAMHAERKAFHEQQARSFEQLEEYLKSRLLAVMMKLGVKKLAGVDFTATQTESARLMVDDEAKIPSIDRYWRVKAPEINKDVIKKDIQEGMDVPGCRIEKFPHVRLR